MSAIMVSHYDKGAFYPTGNDPLLIFFNVIPHFSF